MSARTPEDRPIVLTGPTGWIGRALLALLHRRDDPDGLKAGQEIRLFGSRAGSMDVAGAGSLPIRPLSQISPGDVAGAHVLHLAYLTKDKVAEVGEAAFFETNRAIDDALLNAISSAVPHSLFVASSGAASLHETGRDPHPYGQAKLEQEARFLGWAEQHGVPALCGRIFNIAGPHINKLGAYAVSNFTVQALEKSEIGIAATLPVFRSFLHVEDLCRIVLRAGRNGLGLPRPVDLCGTQIVEMSTIAQAVADEIGGGITLTRPPVDYTSRSDYLGTPQETVMLAMRLGLRLADLNTQVRDTVDWIRAMPAA